MHNFILSSDISNLTGDGSYQLTNSYNTTEDEFIEQLNYANTITEINHLCANIRHYYGFDFFAVFAVFARFNRSGQKPLCFMLREFDNQWTKHYEQKQYVFVDPTIRIGLNKSVPYIWASEKYQQLKPLLSSDEAKIAAEGLDFGLKNIFNAPFHSADGSYGLIRFLNNRQGQDQQCEWVNDMDKQAKLFLLAGHVYQALKRILSSKKQAKSLSQREQDILTWVAQGYNPDNIADKLHISQHTVRNHLRHVRTKLQVKNMTHAVAKAVSSGLILL